MEWFVYSLLIYLAGCYLGGLYLLLRLLAGTRLSWAWRQPWERLRSLPDAEEPTGAAQGDASDAESTTPHTVPVASRRAA